MQNEYTLQQLVDYVVKTHDCKFRDLYEKQYTIAACKFPPNILVIKIDSITAIAQQNLIIINKAITVQSPDNTVIQRLCHNFSITGNLTDDNIIAVKNLICNLVSNCIVGDAPPLAKKPNGFIIGDTLFIYVKNMEQFCHSISRVSSRPPRYTTKDNVILLFPGYKVSCSPTYILYSHFVPTNNTSETPDLRTWTTFTNKVDEKQQNRVGIAIPNNDPQLQKGVLKVKYRNFPFNTTKSITDGGDILIMPYINKLYYASKQELIETVEIVENAIFAKEYNLVKGGWVKEKIKYKNTREITSELMNKVISVNDYIMPFIRKLDELYDNITTDVKKLRVYEAQVRADYKNYKTDIKSIPDGTILAVVKIGNVNYDIISALTVGTDDNVRGLGLAIIVKNKQGEDISYGSCYINKDITQVDEYGLCDIIVQATNYNKSKKYGRVEMSKDIKIGKCVKGEIKL